MTLSCYCAAMSLMQNLVGNEKNHLGQDLGKGLLREAFLCTFLQITLFCILDQVRGGCATCLGP